MRMGLRVSWRLWQPTQAGAIDWSKAASFEKELRLLKAMGIRPVVIVYDSPHWAVQETRRQRQFPLYPALPFARICWMISRASCDR